MVGTGVALVLWLRHEGGAMTFRNIFKEYED